MVVGGGGGWVGWRGGGWLMSGGGVGRWGGGGGGVLMCAIYKPDIDVALMTQPCWQARLIWVVTHQRVKIIFLVYICKYSSTKDLVVIKHAMTKCERNCLFSFSVWILSRVGEYGLLSCSESLGEYNICSRCHQGRCTLWLIMRYIPWIILQ